ncbi:hypothetical protein HPB51_003927 [Rhipicephalus microplus]|uniref:RING-type E3 ubiquitin transferase n=1 Tax=Rhipicephalus microplus TaxID=6941 RepID=A0A9J6EQ67_RHIMP|nr:hypothetical protein HPB51_003927 [Rhipicephalus microplus]
MVPSVEKVPRSHRGGRVTLVVDSAVEAGGDEALAVEVAEESPMLRLLRFSIEALNRNQRVRKHGGDENNGSSGPATPAATACVSVPSSGATSNSGGSHQPDSWPSRHCMKLMTKINDYLMYLSGGLIVDGVLSRVLASTCESARKYEPCEFAPQAATCSNDTESAGGETEETDAEDGDAALNSEIELVFKPQPQMMLEDSSAQVRYIKTTANATVDHLSKYLAMRLALDKFEQDASAPRSVAPFTIYIAVTPGQFTPLPGNMTLDQVNEKYWKVNKPLEMYYAHRKA